jgi:FkbM family methyltransferase
MKQRIKFFLANVLKKITQIINGSYVEGMLVTSEGAKFVVEATDMSVGRCLRKTGNYGKEEKQRIFKLIDESSAIAFIGTHIGALAIPAAKVARKAIFIEANPITYSYLDTNIKINNIKNCSSHNIAVGEKEGEIRFVLSKTNSGGSKREPIKKEHMYYYDHPDTVLVPMVTFDVLARDFSDEFDLVFMDIEGSEYFALKGMQRTLAKTKHLVIEFIPHHLSNVANVSVEEFLSPIIPHFKYCYIPSLRKNLLINEVRAELQSMFEIGLCDEGLIFSKSKVTFE